MTNYRTSCQPCKLVPVSRPKVEPANTVPRFPRPVRHRRLARSMISCRSPHLNCASCAETLRQSENAG